MKKDKSYNGLPFSKKDIVLASRYESYILSIVLILLVWFNKDVSSIAILLSLSWGGYRMVQGLYIWMAKHEHLLQMELEYKNKSLDTTSIDNEIEDLKNQNIENINE
jgi:hypothetical protein